MLKSELIAELEKIEGDPIVCVTAEWERYEATKVLVIKPEQEIWTGYYAADGKFIKSTADYIRIS